jgi:hypothetical protein
MMRLREQVDGGDRFDRVIAVEESSEIAGKDGRIT